MSPPRPVVPTLPLRTAAQARAADQHTIEQLGVPGLVLMEHAGRAVAQRARALAAGRPILVVTGPGNNGGDGWVAARHLAVGGYPSLAVAALKAPDELKGDARTAAQLFVSTTAAIPGGEARYPRRKIEDAAELGPLLDELAPGLVVDAVFGTGLSRPPAGLAGDCLSLLDERSVPVLAVDLPSGLPTDGQAPQGVCLRADHTVTFAGFKVAHFAEPGALWCGQVEHAAIGILPPADEEPEHLLLGATLDVEDGLERALPGPLALPDPGRAAHKGKYGHVGVLEGSPSTRGAAGMAAMSALRSGAGLCTLLVEDAAAGGSPPEVMRRTMQAGEDPRLDGLDVVVVGPGLGRGADGRAKGRAVLFEAARRDIPVVVDAEAIDLLLEGVPGVAAVATPHPGEAGRALGVSAGEVQADRVAALRQLQERAQGASICWLLKGACPLVGLDGGRIGHVPGGSRPLATGGAGDVLSGAIGALLARGLVPADAAAAAALLQQRAGRVLAARRDRGWLASEIAEAMGDLSAEPGGGSAR